MKTKRFYFTRICLIVMCVLVAWGMKPSSVKAEDIRVLGHVVPPFTMHDANGQVYGFSRELLTLAFAGVGNFAQDPDILPVTFNRLYVELQTRDRQVGLAMGRNDVREGDFKWVGPYITVRLGVIAKKSRHFKIKSLADFAGAQIGVVDRAAPMEVLKRLGVDEAILSPDIYPKRNLKNWLRTGLVSWPTRWNLRHT